MNAPSRTETQNAASTDLDLLPTDRLVDLFVDDQLHAIEAVRAARGQLTRAVEAAVPRIAAGGRLIYVGAGTSGRLGMLDSVELYPTFSWPRERSLCLLAGGPTAIVQAVEGAEDDHAQGATDLKALAPNTQDVCLLLAASGQTPYVLGALEAGRAAGALCIGIANNPDAPVATRADIGITLDTGPEMITGSTRLKAGTAQKITLNSFSSAVMVGLHKVYGNLMVDLQPTNAKLVRRAIGITARATGASEDVARRTLESCDFRIKVAIVALLRGDGVDAARARLDAVEGDVRRAIAAS